MLTEPTLTGPSSNLLARIEYYREVDPRAPSGFDLLHRRMGQFNNEYGRWQTLVVDSATPLEVMSRMDQKYRVNPSTRDPRQWWAGGTDSIEELLFLRLPGLPMSVIVICHIDSDKMDYSGRAIRTIKAPGRLSATLPSQYSEVYRTFKAPGEDGKIAYALQTEGSEEFIAATQIGAPNPSYPDYRSLWTNWKGPRLPLHVLLYGEFGTGKSTMASTFPTPILVLACDGQGKDTPYLRLGQFTDLKQSDLGVWYREVHRATDDNPK